MSKPPGECKTVPTLPKEVGKDFIGEMLQLEMTPEEWEVFSKDLPPREREQLPYVVSVQT